MRVLEADIDRIRLSVWRPARGEAALLLLVILALGIVPLGWLAVVGHEIAELRQGLEDPPPDRLRCRWETLSTNADCAESAPYLLELPSLAEVYLARRTFHRAALFPTAFEAPPPVVAPLHPALADLASDDRERRLLGQALRDGRARASGALDESTHEGWIGRDPILGLPLGRLPDDQLTRDRIEIYEPALPDLVDRTATPPEQLVSEGILRELAEGVYGIADPEATARVASRAAEDVRTWVALREAAVVAAVEARYAADLSDHHALVAGREAGIETWRLHRRQGVPFVVGAFVVALLLLLPMSWLLRRRFPVSIDLHALTLGEMRLLWESIDELTWTHRRVSWHLEDGREGEVRDLALSDTDVRILERTSTAVWLRDRGGSPHPAYRAIRSLIEGARRSV